MALRRKVRGPTCVVATLLTVCGLLSGAAHAERRSSAPAASAEYAQLQAVQARFNRLERVADIRLWGADEYWATPAELLRAGGGDCEDLAIAKYFALRDAGVPADRLRLVYARVFDTRRRIIQPHVVLWYRVAAHADWLVLDSLVNRIQPLAERKDLLPRLTFNEHRVAFWRGAESETAVGGPERIARWRSVLDRHAAERALAAVPGDRRS